MFSCEEKPMALVQSLSWKKRTKSSTVAISQYLKQKPHCVQAQRLGKENKKIKMNTHVRYHVN
jgi:hypothetical protein